MTYKVMLVNDWTRPYQLDGGRTTRIKNVEASETLTDDEEVAVSLIKSMLDTPDAELAIDAVRRDFGEFSSPEAIVSYYNGRLALCERATAELRTAAAAGHAAVMRYEIPYEYNHMLEPGEGEMQNSAYLEVSVTNETA